jgi:hypothetical protein
MSQVYEKETARERLLNACKVLEALKPYVGTGRGQEQIAPAWDIAFHELQDACSDYRAHWGPEEEAS